jgi:hypothetical protein
MPIVLEASYQKKVGLPAYSSHQYSVTIRMELTDREQLQAESAKLYRALQDAVDREIQQFGFIPEARSYGRNSPTNGNGRHHSHPGNGEKRKRQMSGMRAMEITAAARDGAARKGSSSSSRETSGRTISIHATWSKSPSGFLAQG